MIAGHMWYEPVQGVLEIVDPEPIFTDVRKIDRCTAPESRWRAPGALKQAEGHGAATGNPGRSPRVVDLAAAR